MLTWFLDQNHNFSMSELLLLKAYMQKWKFIEQDGNVKSVLLSQACFFFGGGGGGGGGVGGRGVSMLFPVCIALTWLSSVWIL